MYRNETHKFNKSIIINNIQTLCCEKCGYKIIDHKANKVISENILPLLDKIKFKSIEIDLDEYVL